MKKHWAYLAILCFAGVCLSQGKQSANSRFGLFQDHADVGASPRAGDTVYDGVTKEYRVTGGGANIWAKVDAFQFVFTKLSGDVALTADVRFIGAGVEQHRKAALMIRQSLDPDAPYADIAVHGDGLTSLQYRETPGDVTKEIRSDLKAPARVRISRQGNQFTVAVSNPGGEWKPLGPVTINLQDPLYVGLAVCSHNADVRETAVFSNVELVLGNVVQSALLGNEPTRHFAKGFSGLLPPAKRIARRA